MPDEPHDLTPRDELTEFLLYTAPGGEVKVEVFLHDENLWLPQKRIAELFGVQRPAITKHLANIFQEQEHELEKDAVCSILEHTAEDGKTYKTKYYNLDAIIDWGMKLKQRSSQINNYYFLFKRKLSAF